MGNIAHIHMQSEQQCVCVCVCVRACVCAAEQIYIMPDQIVTGCFSH